MNIALLRAAALYVPLLGLLCAAAVVRPTRRQAVGSFFAFCFCLPAIVLTNAVAQILGWWSFRADGGLLLGIPVDLLLGWCIAWGPLATLACGRLKLPIVVVLLLWLDLLLMPHLAPLVVLHETWLRGEALALAIALVPVQLLARLTIARRGLGVRVGLLVVAFSALLLWLLPAAILQETGGSFAPVLALSVTQLSLWLQVGALPALLGLSAVQELFVRGGGTPVPFDPPVRLVRSGVYRYVANPMQLAIVVLLALEGLVLRSAWVGAAALVGIAYGEGLARWHEEAEMSGRHGAAYRRYRAEVRRWLPRLRPRCEGDPARLYLMEGCAVCQALRKFIARRRPVGLALLAAENHPRRTLFRLTYDPGDGSPEEEGAGALGRALEHLHLGYALLGLALRLPVVRTLAVLLADTVGAGPRAALRGQGAIRGSLGK